MPINEGTPRELDIIIAEIGNVCNDLSAKRRQLDEIINLDPMMSETLSSQGRSSRSRRRKPVPEEEPGKNALQMERVKLAAEIEQLSIKEMELGQRKRELEQKQDAKEC